MDEFYIASRRWQRVDETGVAKKGEKTPGVQRQYCGSTGKIDNCVVSVHPALGYGPFSCLIPDVISTPDTDQQRILDLLKVKL